MSCFSSFFFFSSRRRHTRLTCDWSSDVCSSDLVARVRVIKFEPVFQAGGSLLLRRLERGLKIVRQSRQRCWRGDNRGRRRAAGAIFGFFLRLHLLPVPVKLLAAPDGA